MPSEMEREAGKILDPDINNVRSLLMGLELSLLAVRRSRPPRDLRVDPSEWAEDPREMRRVRVGGMVGQEAMLQRPSGTHALLHLRP